VSYVYISNIIQFSPATKATAFKKQKVYLPEVQYGKELNLCRQCWKFTDDELTQGEVENLLSRTAWPMCNLLDVIISDPSFKLTPKGDHTPYNIIRYRRMVNSIIKKTGHDPYNMVTLSVALKNVQLNVNGASGASWRILIKTNSKTRKVMLSDLYLVLYEMNQSKEGIRNDILQMTRYSHMVSSHDKRVITS
jgi:hypothetical protein